MSKTFSGKEVIAILCRIFEFGVVGQKGSHVKLIKTFEGRTITTIVPLHTELKKGTLNSVLNLAEIGIKDFLSKKDE